jgi:hypothetical protein
VVGEKTTLSRYTLYWFSVKDAFHDAACSNLFVPVEITKSRKHKLDVARKMHTFEQAVNYWCREKSGKARKTTAQSYTVIDCKTCCAAAKCTYVGGVLEHRLERVGQERARSVYSGLVDAAGSECNPTVISDVNA